MPGYPRRRRKLRKMANDALAVLRDTLVRENEDDKLDLQQDVQRQTDAGDNKYDIQREAAFDQCDIDCDVARINLVKRLIEINEAELASTDPAPQT